MLSRTFAHLWRTASRGRSSSAGRRGPLAVTSEYLSGDSGTTATPPPAIGAGWEAEGASFLTCYRAPSPMNMPESTEFRERECRPAGHTCTAAYAVRVSGDAGTAAMPPPAPEAGWGAQGGASLSCCRSHSHWSMPESASARARECRSHRLPAHIHVWAGCSCGARRRLASSALRAEKGKRRHGVQY